MASDEETTRRLRDKLKRELGPVVMDALNDAGIVEVMLNPDGILWADSHERGLHAIGEMAHVQAENLICTIASMLRIEATFNTPIVEGELPLDGSRFEGILHPIVTAPIFTIRKRAGLVYPLDGYVSSGSLTIERRNIIADVVNRRGNILVAGATGSGKTTFCNAILKYISDTDPNTRIVIIEDTRELQCPAKNRVELRTAETVSMIALLRATMRLRPDRIVVGEVRGPEVLALIKAWNTGHPGGVATVHANGAEAALVRVEQLIEEGSVPPSRAVIAEAIDLIVSIQRTSEGRKITEVMEVKGHTTSGYVLNRV